MRNCILLLIALVCIAGKSFAQNQQVLPCYSDENYKKQVAMHPEILQARAELEKQIKDGLQHVNYNKIARRTTTDQSGNAAFWYDIPVVVHVIHDFNNGEEYLTDDAIFNDLIDWNFVYANENSDTSNVIAPYSGNIPNSNVRYIGNGPVSACILQLQTPMAILPKGSPRRRSYTTYTAGDQAKFDNWPSTSYINLWVVNDIVVDNGEAAAYAQFPDNQAASPATDGVICDWSYFANAYSGVNAVSKTINHELGHCFNLLHPWNNNTTGGEVATSCGDDDVDDTPPTKGHNPTGCVYDATALYDTTCAFNYYQVYPGVKQTDSIVNYPDTTNAQNIMDYTYCARMFTAGQVARMHATLNSSVGGRNNLWDTTNLMNTGVWDANYNPLPRRDLKPIPDFAISKSANGQPGNYMDRLNYFIFPGSNATFYNESWNDTVTNVMWTFYGGATIPTSTATNTVINSFSSPGWDSLTMKVTGNNTGDTTVTWHNALFVANATGTPGKSIFQEFAPTGDRASWPTFNYYNNEFKWQLANVGEYDNYSMEYVGFDSRIDPVLQVYPITGPPNGDVDDFFTIPVDLTSYTAGNCSLNFDYSGASRSSTSNAINDTLEIDYNVNKGVNWTRLTVLSKGTLDNKGAVATAYTPVYASDWSHMSIDIPASAITNYTTFRFRYKPGSAPPVGTVSGNPASYSSGNNFYMDRINFSEFPASVGNVNLSNADIAVVPNPTSRDAYVVLKDANNTYAHIIVTDVTGKVVYTTSQQVTGNEAYIQIPHSAISVKGMYIVQATTGAKTLTQKLVVY